jgi:hypothetical protein
MLEERASDHNRGRMTMKTRPGPTFEAVEAKFLFQLLMGLLADPSCLDCGSQVAQVPLGWQVGKIVLFSREALLADDGSHQQRWIKISPVLPVASSIMGFEDEVD